jgi:hypothetical protein
VSGDENTALVRSVGTATVYVLDNLVPMLMRYLDHNVYCISLLLVSGERLQPPSTTCGSGDVLLDER